MALSHSERSELIIEEQELERAIIAMAQRFEPPSVSENQIADRWFDRLDVVRKKLGRAISMSGELNQLVIEDIVDDDQAEELHISLPDPQGWRKAVGGGSGAEAGVA
jgi:hypothetical protein